MAVASKLLKDAVVFCSVSHSPYSQRRELEYDKFLRDKMVVTKNGFRALLRETKKITYRLVEPLPHFILCIAKSHSHVYFLGAAWEWFGNMTLVQVGMLPVIFIFPLQIS